jgi:hypothetical protein
MLEGLEGSRRWTVFGLLLLCHIYFLQIYPHFISPNELSRLLLSSAIVDDHSLTVDGAIKRFRNTQDKAFFDGHFYSDKAIGVSLLAIPAFIIIRAVESIFRTLLSTQMTILLLRILTVTIPSLLFLKILTAFWLKLRPDARYIPYFVFLHLFGTIAFTYSGQFISHYLLGIFLFCSVYYLNEYWSGAAAKNILFAGLFSGICLLMEFPAVLPVGVIGLFALFTTRTLHHRILFVLSVLPFIFLILIYNYLIFGTPWDVTYRHMTHSFHVSQHAQGIVGMGIPKIAALYGLLFSRHHGMFFISPFLLLSIPGFFRMITSDTWSRAGKLFLGIVITTILTYSAFSYWIAGWNFGPRYITPALPFLSTAAFYYGEEYLQKSTISRIIFATLAIWSVVCVTVGTITFPFPPANLLDPIFFLNFPLLLNGATGTSLGGSVWIFFAILFCTFLVLTFPKSETQIHTSAVGRGFVAVLLSGLLFGVAFLSRPAPSAMEYYARGSVYLYLGQYKHSLSEMYLALDADPDLKSRQLIEKRVADLNGVINR